MHNFMFSSETEKVYKTAVSDTLLQKQAYNLVENKPYLEANESCITPIRMVPDEAIMDSSAEGIKDTADFLSKDSDSSLEES